MRSRARSFTMLLLVVAAVLGGLTPSQASYHTAPNNYITTPDKSVIANGDPLIQGTADDDVAVASVIVKAYDVSGKSQKTFTAFCDPSCPNASVSWSVKLAGLLPGAYTITATATDTVGQTSKKSILVVFVS